jgi:hypothetical protein
MEPNERCPTSDSTSSGGGICGLSGGAIEVLRALVLGLDLRETATGWLFVGPEQKPEHSWVRPDTMSELLGKGFIQRTENGFAKLTPRGSEELRAHTEGIMRRALKWVQHHD